MLYLHNLHYEKFSDGSIKCIEKELPFTEPKGWSWTRLGNVGCYKKGPFGSSITKAMFVPESDKAIKVYEQKNAINKDATIGKYYISEEKFESLKSFEVFPNDIIVSCAGTIGEAFVLPQNMRKGIINQALMKISLYDITMLDFYLIYFDLRLKVTAQEQGHGSALKNIPPFDKLKKYLIPIPPAREQERIVKTVKRYTNIISEINHNKTDISILLEKTKSKILDLAIRGKLVPQDPKDEPAKVLLERIRKEKEDLIKAGKLKRDKRESIIFRGDDNSYYEKFSNGEIKCINDKVTLELPNGWGWCRLRDLFTVSSSKRVLQSDWCSSGVPFYRAREIVKLSENGSVDNELFISVEHYKKITEEYGVPQAGDLMVSGVGTIGKVYIVQDTDKFYYKDASVLCFQNRTGFVNPDFARFMLESEFIQRQMKNNSYGTTVDTITISSAMDYLCMLPPVEEQQRIVKSVKNIAKKLSYIEESITLMI